MLSTDLGRKNKRLSLIHPKVWARLVALGAVVVLFVCWHAALVVNGGAGVFSVGTTLMRVLTFDPLHGADMTATLAVFVVVAAAAIGGLTWWELRRAGRVEPAAGLADGDTARAAAGEQRARDKAAWTRRDSVRLGVLDPVTAPLADVGLLIGYKHDDGEPVILALEDQVGVMAATGSGKTRDVMIGPGVDAPGPMVATSTRPELLDAFMEARSARGRVWVFEPLDASHWPELMIWDPVAGCEDQLVAASRGAAFAGGASGSGTPDAEFFQNAVAIIMSRLLHAAALSGQDMTQVIRWGTDLAGSAASAIKILRGSPEGQDWANTLQTATVGADETISGVRMTMGQKLEPMLTRRVMRQLTPQPGVSMFDPARFVRSNDTLIIITDDQAQTNVAPLSTMLLNEVIDAAKAAAAVSPTGMIDPPLRVIGDEIVAVAPLPKLPYMLADSRGFGVQWIIAYQSLAQILFRWGAEAGRMLMVNLNCSLVLGGLQDEQALKRFSELVGMVDVQQITSHMDEHNNVTMSQVQEAERTAMRPEEIRQLPDGQALVIYRNNPAMIIDLIPWKERADGDRIEASIARIRGVRIRNTP